MKRREIELKALERVPSARPPRASRRVGVVVWGGVWGGGGWGGAALGPGDAGGAAKKLAHL